MDEDVDHNLKDKFEKIKESLDSEEINDFLIKLGNNAKVEYLNLIDYFLEKINHETFLNIKLNLVWVLGEIGKSEKINDKYVEYLIEEYYRSDRWVRKEIINAFEKILKRRELPNPVIELIGRAVNEDYIDIKISALQFLLNLKNISDSILKNILLILKLRNSELIEHCSIILKRFITNENQLFDLLINLENYKNLNKKAIRTLLVIFFDSVVNLEFFRELLFNYKEWDSEHKELFLNEIDAYQRILLRNL